MSGTIEDLPPSAKLVYTVLDHEGSLTQQGIADESRLPGRTVRDALDRLRERGIVSSSIHFPDARQRVYRLRSAGEETPAIGQPVSR